MSSQTIPSSFDGVDEDLKELNFIDKCIQNCKEQPFVPIGTLLTTAAVVMAAKSVRTGEKANAQKWFRRRVAFQGLTILALVVGGVYFGQETKAAKIDREEKLRQKAKLREQLWIEELERRDDENKARKRRAELAREAMKKQEKED